MHVREVFENEKGIFNDYVAKSPVGDLLQSFEWGELKKRSGGWQPIRLAAFDGEQVVGTVSILKRKLPKVNKCIFYAPRGPVCDFSNVEVVRALADAVRELGARHGAILFKVDPPVTSDNTEAVRVLTESGFVEVSDVHGFGGVQPRCVMQLDLTPTLEEVLAGCKPKWRYNIRLAEKKGVIVRVGENEADLALFYDVLKETAERDRFLVRGFEYYKHMWDTLVVPGYARLFLTEYEGEVVAGALSFIFGDKCWYTYGASSNRHRNVMPNHLMQWRMIEWAKESGCSWYDFRGVSQEKDSSSSDHLSGLNRFKEGFGARFVEYIGEFDTSYSPAWYWAWTTLKPKAISFMKSLKRSSKASMPEGE